MSVQRIFLVEGGHIDADTDDVSMKTNGVRVFNYPNPKLWTFYPWDKVLSIQLLAGPERTIAAVREFDETDQDPT